MPGSCTVYGVRGCVTAVLTPASPYTLLRYTLRYSALGTGCADDDEPRTDRNTFGACEDGTPRNSETITTTTTTLFIGLKTHTSIHTLHKKQVLAVADGPARRALRRVVHKAGARFAVATQPLRSPYCFCRPFRSVPKKTLKFRSTCMYRPAEKS